MNKYIIIINGLGGVGKSEFIKQCFNVVENSDKKIGIAECSTVDYVKEVARFCGWNGEKGEKDRVFLSDLKQTLQKWNDSPLRDPLARIEKIFNIWEDDYFDYAIAFINSREPEDIEFFAQQAALNNINFIKLYVSNDRIQSNEVSSLIQGIIDFKNNCDYHISNNGTLDQLRATATYFIEDLIGEKLTNVETKN